MSGSGYRTASLLAVAPLVLGLAAGAARAIEVQQVAGATGVRAWLVESRQLPVIAVDFAFRDAGSVADPPDRDGLARFGARMLLEGAGDLDARAFQESLAEMGAVLVFAADRDGLIGHLEVAREHRDRAFDLLRLALSRPRFDADAIERVRRWRTVELARLEADPTYVALRAWWRNVFPDHPYGRDPDGAVQDIAAVTAADLRTSFMPRLARTGLIVAAAGAIDAQELTAAVDRVVADLPSGTDKPELPDAAFVAAPPKIHRLPFPQSACVFGQPGVSPQSADYLPALVLNHVIGGGTLTSRLFVEMRERRGLVYSIRTVLETLRGANLLIGHFSTENAKVRDAVAVVRREWQRAADGHFTDSDVAEAKDYLKGAFLVSLNGSAAISAKLLAVQRLGLDVEHFAKWEERISGIEPGTVRTAAQNVIRPEALSFAIAGDPNGL